MNSQLCFEPFFLISRSKPRPQHPLKLGISYVVGIHLGAQHVSSIPHQLTSQINASVLQPFLAGCAGSKLQKEHFNRCITIILFQFDWIDGLRLVLLTDALDGYSSAVVSGLPDGTASHGLLSHTDRGSITIIVIVTSITSIRTSFAMTTMATTTAVIVGGSVTPLPPLMGLSRAI